MNIWPHGRTILHFIFIYKRIQIIFLQASFPESIAQRPEHKADRLSITSSAERWNWKSHQQLLSFHGLKDNKVGLYVHVDVAAVVMDVSVLTHYPDVVVGQGHPLQTASGRDRTIQGQMKLNTNSWAPRELVCLQDASNQTTHRVIDKITGGFIWQWH